MLFHRYVIFISIGSIDIIYRYQRYQLSLSVSLIPYIGTGNIDIIATNTTDAPISGTIVVTPSFENGGDINVGDPITFEITVNPTGQVNSVGNQIVSNGFDTSLVEFSTTNVNGTTTFSWTNDLTTIGLAASGTGDIPAFTAINTGTSPVIATITVTPTF